MPKARLVFNGDNVYIEKDARIYGLKDDIASKIDGIPGVIDSLDSTSPDDALSANMGRVLQDQINAMSGIGNFLSTWDCTTGLPGTNPQVDPYTYNAGDYYIVSNVGATNYKPHGGTFVQGVPSTTVETENVGINDKYFFDGADWVRIPNTATQITIDTALSTTSTNAVENRAIANAINTKQDTISDLSTIRSGAALGSTALQPGDNITELTNNVGYQTAGDVEVAISEHFYVGAAAPQNPSEGMLWYDTTGDILKTYNGASWESSAGGEGKQAFFKTQAEYNALPASKETDGNLYIIVDTHTEPSSDLLCFTAEQANSTIKLINSSKYNAHPGYQPKFEVSRDGALWFPFDVEYANRPGDTIVLENVGDKIYMRNISETPTNFNLGDGIYHHFVMTGVIGVSGDIGYLLCKNSTTTLSGKFGGLPITGLFEGCPITTTPSLPATSVGAYAYTQMFSGCTMLTTIPALPATGIDKGTYTRMFAGCPIKLSETQDDEYTQPYRIPMEGTGTDSGEHPRALYEMFSGTGGTFTGTPEINKTYYVHKSIRIV